MSRKKTAINPVDPFDHSGVKFSDRAPYPDYSTAMEGAVSELEATLSAGKMTVAEFYEQIKILRNTYLQKGSELWWEYTNKINEYQNKEREKQFDRNLERLGSMYSIGLISSETYYEKLGELRDGYLKVGTEKWQEMTDKIGELAAKNAVSAYEKALEGAAKFADGLYGESSQSLLRNVTVKDENGNTTDRFFMLSEVDTTALSDFAKGYDYLKALGAQEGVLSEYLSGGIERGGAFLEALGLHGDEGEYIAKMNGLYSDAAAFAGEIVNVSGLADALKQVLSELSEQGYFKAGGVEINQTIYGNNLSPADASREIVSALKLSGVGI